MDRAAADGSATLPARGRGRPARRPPPRTGCASRGCARGPRASAPTRGGSRGPRRSHRPDRPHLDGAVVPEARAVAGKLGGLVERRGGHEQVATAQVLRLGVGAVGDHLLLAAQDLAAIRARVAALEVARLAQRLDPGAPLLHALLHLLRAQAQAGHVAAAEDVEEVGHRRLLVAGAAGWVCHQDDWRHPFRTSLIRAGARCPGAPSGETLRGAIPGRRRGARIPAWAGQDSSTGRRARRRPGPLPARPVRGAAVRRRAAAQEAAAGRGPRWGDRWGRPSPAPTGPPSPATLPRPPPPRAPSRRLLPTPSLV